MPARLVRAAGVVIAGIVAVLSVAMLSVAILRPLLDQWDDEPEGVPRHDVAAVQIEQVAGPMARGHRLLVATDEQEPGFGDFRNLLPAILPEPSVPGQCGAGWIVTLTLADGRDVEYGPCGRPGSIQRAACWLLERDLGRACDFTQ